MKTLKTYNIIAPVIIVLFAIWVVDLRKDLQETEMLLEQCADRYYQEINK